MLHHTDYSTDHVVILAQIETRTRGSVLRQQYLYHARHNSRSDLEQRRCPSFSKHNGVHNAAMHMREICFRRVKPMRYRNAVASGPAI